MASIITGKDQMLGRWAAKQIPHIGKVENLGKFVALGVATGPAANDRLMAVCIVHEFFPQYGHCQISFASADPRWVSRATVRALLSVPFLQYRCKTVRVSIPHTSERTIRLVRALGFKSEATLKDFFGEGVHSVVCRMGYGHYEKMYWSGRPKMVKAA